MTWFRRRSGEDRQRTLTSETGTLCSAVTSMVRLSTRRTVVWQDHGGRKSADMLGGELSPAGVPLHLPVRRQRCLGSLRVSYYASARSK